MRLPTSWQPGAVLGRRCLVFTAVSGQAKLVGPPVQVLLQEPIQPGILRRGLTQVLLATQQWRARAKSQPSI